MPRHKCIPASLARGIAGQGGRDDVSEESFQFRNPHSYGPLPVINGYKLL